jgi:hypothetical protein
MILLIEIMLTASAWRKGWKGWVLLPWAVMFFTITLLCGNVSDKETAFGITGDIILIIILGIMASIVHVNQT